VNVIKCLMERGADVNAKYKNGMTPLMMASDNGSVEMVALLVAGGADLNARNKDGWTPQMVAAKNNNLGVADFLKLKGSKTE
jgi:ankyrin repeat protein